MRQIVRGPALLVTGITLVVATAAASLSARGAAASPLDAAAADPRAPAAIPEQQPESLVKIIHAATMYDGRGGTRKNVWVVVRGGDIERVSASPVQLAGAQNIELGAATLMPGLIDAHTHPGWYVDRNGKRNSQRSGDSPEQAFAARAANLKATLLAGFTTIQSLGGPEDAELRAATSSHRIPGPRVLTSITQLSNVRLNADSLRKLVDDLALRQHADVIKLFASSGLGSGGAQTFSDEQIAAICSEAKQRGLRSVVHAISAASIRASVLGGCTQIEHGIFATDAELTLMASRGTIFDPQVCLVFQNYIDHPDAYSFTDSTLKPLRDALPTALAMFKRAISTRGLTVLFGTDAVALAHGNNADELVCRVKAGQSPMDAIVSATSANAAAMGLGSRLGRIEAAFAADLIAVNGDPQQNISAMKRVVFVMRDGRQYK